jgi:hypothetical protein
MRLLPLAAVFTYVFGAPERNLNEPPVTGTVTRNAEPERTWQSVQWQIKTKSGSTSAS